MSLSPTQIMALIVLAPIGMVSIGAWFLARRKHSERTAREEEARKPWGWNER